MMTNMINDLPTVAHRVILRALLQAPTLSDEAKTKLLRQLQQEPKIASSGELGRCFKKIVNT